MASPKKKSSAADVARAIKKLADKKQAAILQRFFKTEKRQYGEGDHFLGIRVPFTRSVVKKYYKDLTLADLDYLLSSKWHEVRQAGVIAMNQQFTKSPNQADL